MAQGNGKRIEERIKDLLPILIAIIPIVSVVASICAYIYEISFCNYFGITPDLISISWTRFLICSLFVFMVIVPVVLLLVSLKAAPKKDIRVFALVGTVLAVGLSLILKLVGELNSWAEVFILVVIVAIVNFYIPAGEWLVKYSNQISKRPKKERKKPLILACLIVILLTVIRLIFAEKIVSSLLIGILLLGLICLLFFNKEIQEFHFKEHFRRFKFLEGHGALCKFLSILFYPLKFLLWLIHLLKVKNILEKLRIDFFAKKIPAFLIICLCFSPFLLYAYFGSSEAKGEIVYSIPSFLQNPSTANLSVNQSLVVLRIYGDKAICAAVNNESGKYYLAEPKQFVMLPLENVILTPEKIGPLYLK